MYSQKITAQLLFPNSILKFVKKYLKMIVVKKNKKIHLKSKFKKQKFLKFSFETIFIVLIPLGSLCVHATASIQDRLDCLQNCCDLDPNLEYYASNIAL